MGRKSKAKKIIREILQEKKEKEIHKFLVKKSKKEIKQQLKETRKDDHIAKNDIKESKPKFIHLKKVGHKIKIHRYKIFGGVFSLIMLSILVSAGYLIFQKAFSPSEIAKFLPVEHTVATLEINTNFEHRQTKNFFTLFKKYPQFQKDNLIKIIEAQSNLNFKTDIEPWLGRQVGIALIDSDTALNKLYFAEIFDQKKLSGLLSDQSEQLKYRNEIIEKLPNSTFATIIDDYIFISDNQEEIKRLIDFSQSDRQRLADTDRYNRIENNLPLNKFGFLYIDFNQINSHFFTAFPQIGNNGFTQNVIQPFLKLFDAEGMAFITSEENLAIQSFLGLDTSALKGRKYITLEQKYSADLADYINQNAIAFWGAENMEKQILKMIEVVAGNDQNVNQIFDKLLDNYVKRYFGNQIKLESDILPLLSREFAFSIEKHDQNNIYNLLIELENDKSGALKLGELADNFAKTGAFFKPKIVEYKLPDGTAAKEIRAIPAEIKRSENKYEGITIFALEMSEKDWSIYYSIIDNVAVISNDLNGIKSTIDLKNGKQKSIKNNAAFRNNMEEVLSSSDELGYFNLEKLLPLIFANGTPEYLKPFSNLSSGRNYFNDGISSINYLTVQ